MFLATLNSQMDLMQILIMLVIILVAIIGLAIFLFISGNILNHKLKALTNNISDFVSFNQDRIEKIRPYILSYFNSLHAGDDTSIETLNKIIFTLESRIAYVGRVLQYGKNADKRLAIKYIIAPIPLKTKDYFENNLNGEEDEVTITPETHPEDFVKFEAWEDTIDTLLKGIGEKIIAASIKTTMYRNNNKQKKDTIFALTEAGLININRLNEIVHSVQNEQQSDDPDKK